MPELRKDPITGRWVIISTDRAKRPSDFVRESVRIEGKGFCPFCLGNETKTPPEVLAYGRNGGGPNTPGWTVRVVPNKFPALGIEGDLDRQGDGLFDRMNGVGAHEIIVVNLKTQKVSSRVELDQTFYGLGFAPDGGPFTFHGWRNGVDLKNDKRFRYALIFKNHGDAAGASLEHSHSQLIALPIVPKRVREELDASKHYYREKERCIFCDMIRQETESGVRVVGENDQFVTIAPYAPRFPFELWLLPKQHSSAFENNQSSVYSSLARMLKDTLARLDSVLDHPAYNFMLHTSPVGEEINDHYHWHFEIMPKLTKVAGFEWGTGFYICPTPPEESARFLREAQVAATSAV